MVLHFLNIGADHFKGGGSLGLDRGIDDPVELYVGQRMVARGELVELEGETKGRLGLRVTEIAEHGDAS